MSPFWLPTKAWSASSPALRFSAIAALDIFALGPSSQTIGNSPSATFACHQVSATTATELSPTATTFLTPLMPANLVAAKLFHLPPDHGQSPIAGVSNAGRFVSNPKNGFPVT